MAGNGPANTPRIVLQLSDHDQGLLVTVADAPDGAGLTANVVLQRLEDVLRLASQPTFHQDVGRGLFRALFPGPLEEVYRVALAEATVQGTALELELRFERPAVRAARYPWELLHDGTRFPLQTGALRLTRALPCAEPPATAAFDPLCEMLFVAAHPTDHPPLVPHYQALAEALAGAVASGRLDLAYLLPPTWDAFMDWLLAGAPSIVHFEGHAALTRTGRLLFTDERGAADPVDAEWVAAALRGSALRLVTLGAAAQLPAPDDLPAGAAPWLVLAGVPEVLALQGTLPPEEALAFWRTFYAALLDGEPVADALDRGRRALRRTVCWHVPAHFVRATHPLTGRRGALEVRLDTAAPRAVPVGHPVRVGLWLSAADAPPPSAEALRRLIGVSPTRWGDEDSAPSPESRQAQTQGRLSAGAVEVLLAAEGCAVHTPPVRVTLMPGSEPLPLWFALTPHRAGTIEACFVLVQGGTPLVELEHPLEAVRGEDAPVGVAVLSHYWPGAMPERPPVLATAAPPPDDLSAAPPMQEAPPADLPSEATPDPVHVAQALEEVLAWLRSGAATSASASEPPLPSAPAPLAPPSAPDIPPVARRVAGLRGRDLLVLILALALIWATIAALALTLTR